MFLFKETYTRNYRDYRHGALQAKETLKSYEICHFVSFDGGDNLGFLRIRTVYSL